MDWVVLNADQTANGVLIMWDRRVLEKSEVLVGSFSVSIQWKGVEDGVDNNVRGYMWDEFVGI